MRKEQPFVSIYSFYSVSTDNIFIVIVHKVRGYDLLLFMLFVGDGVSVSLHV
jgi:hypothetical protein